MRFTMKNGKRVILPDSNEDDWKTRKNMSQLTSQKDEMQHTHEDGTSHSHEGGDQPHHHHEDGTVHDHEGGDQPHTHDEETPNLITASDTFATIDFLSAFLFLISTPISEAISIK